MSEENLGSNFFIKESGMRKIKLWRNNLILLTALMVLVFVAPVLDHLSTLVGNTALMIVVLAGIFAAEYRRRIFMALLIVGLLVFISMGVSMIFPKDRFLNALPFLLAICSLIFSSIALIAHVSQAQRVEKAMLLCAINAYLMMGLTASLIFLILDLIEPNSFKELQAAPASLSHFIYYGFVTLSTLGYGDITPSAPLARSLAVFTALIGQLYLVIVMALIIGKFVNSSDKQ